MARAKEVLPCLLGCETVERLLANVTWRARSFPANPVGTGIPQGKQKAVQELLILSLLLPVSQKEE